jgi:hypothetical protein
MSPLSSTTRRVIAGVALVGFLGCAANYYLGLHAFGRFDRLILALYTLFMAILVTALRHSMPAERPTFSWPAFAVFAVGVVGVCAWVACSDHAKSGSWDFGRLTFLVVPATLLVFMAYRWRLLRRELLDGTFSDERYHADPGAYLFGPWRQWLLWMALAVSLVIACTVFYVLLGT